MPKILEITLDKLISNQSIQNGKTGWKEPSKKLSEKTEETYRVIINEACSLCDNLLEQNINQSIFSNSVDSIIIYNEEQGFLTDSFTIFEKIINQKISEVFESRVRTSMCMNISIQNEMPKLLKAVLLNN